MACPISRNHLESPPPHELLYRHPLVVRLPLEVRHLVGRDRDGDPRPGPPSKAGLCGLGSELAAEALAELLLEVANTPTVVGAWRPRPGTFPEGRESYGRDVVISVGGSPALIALAAFHRDRWSAVVEGVIGEYPSREAAMAACDEHLRAKGWVLL